MVFRRIRRSCLDLLSFSICHRRSIFLSTVFSLRKKRMQSRLRDPREEVHSEKIHSSAIFSQIADERMQTECSNIYQPFDFYSIFHLDHSGQCLQYQVHTNDIQHETCIVNSPQNLIKLFFSTLDVRISEIKTRKSLRFL